MVRPLIDVTTLKEKVSLTNVRWGKLGQKADGTSLPELNHPGMITGIWKTGCSLLTQKSLIAGETIWIRALDEKDQVVLSQVAVVTWNESVFRADGSRCEVRFVDLSLTTSNA